MALELPIRPRRNRRTSSLRALVRETAFGAGDLILPLFVHDGPRSEAIDSMPGCRRWCLDDLVEEAGEVLALGIPAVVLFPSISAELKTSGAEEAWNPDGLVPRAVRCLKEAHPELMVMTDVALDPYNSDGHDGLVTTGRDGGVHVLNDETVAALCRQALAHAEAGADVLAPSDMMDGRIGAIRRGLDERGYEEVALMSYTAKYASALYGPFRGALDSQPGRGHKAGYQMDPANAREALRELQLDEAEGADVVMVKPAGIYLDVIAAFRQHTCLPVAAYQVSGEYLMIKSAAESGWLELVPTVLESLMAIKRAGADMVITYFAKEVAEHFRQVR